MKPETYNRWEKALGNLEEADELKKLGKSEKATEKATAAFWEAMQAWWTLSEEMEMPDLRTYANNAAHEWIEFRDGKHYAPNKMVDWVRGSLKRLSDYLPPDTFRPLS